MLQNNLDPEDLIRKNLELENQIDEVGDLHPLKEENTSILSVNKHVNGYSLFFLYSIPSQLRKKLLKIKPEVLFHNHAKTKTIINKFIPCENAHTYIGYYFAYLPKEQDFSIVKKDDNRYIIQLNNITVSAAWAQEENGEAIELAVETLLEYQGNGYGRKVVSACAYDAINKGKIAFYSYIKSNEGSKALSKRLDISKYAESTVYS